MIDSVQGVKRSRIMGSATIWLRTAAEDCVGQQSDCRGSKEEFEEKKKLRQQV